MDARRRQLAENLRIALDLHDAGLEMKLAQLARTHPTASADELEDLLQAWLEEQARTEYAHERHLVVRVEGIRT